LKGSNRTRFIKEKNTHAPRLLSKEEKRGMLKEETATDVTARIRLCLLHLEWIDSDLPVGQSPHRGKWNVLDGQQLASGVAQRLPAAAAAEEENK
jgi:hypothetical protein